MVKINIMPDKTNLLRYKFRCAPFAPVVCKVISKK